jgi:CMP-N-acetylneuraminic acid synthetase
LNPNIIPLIRNRQEINNPVYYRNGIAYILRIKTALENNGEVPQYSNFQVTDRQVSNIDTELDLWSARIINFKENIYKLFKIKI